MDEKFSLKWSKFQQHTSLTFKDLRDDKDYFDVTLACDDNKDVAAHKVILSSCSPYFRSLLSRNKHPHPLVYMRGMESRDVERILDFMYQGEVDVAQDNLARFLEIADELKINGLDSSEHDRNNANISDGLNESSSFQDVKPYEQTAPRMSAMDMPIPMLPMRLPPAKQFSNPEPVSFPLKQEYPKLVESELIGARYDEYEDSSLIVDENSGNNSPRMVKNAEGDDPMVLIESLMQRIENGKWRCTVCLKMQKSRNHCREHVEIHVEGLSYACDYCGKSCRTTGALRAHRRTQHHKKQEMLGALSLELA